MAIVRERAEIVDADRDETRFDRAMDDPVLQGRLEHAGEDGDDVDLDHSSIPHPQRAVMASRPPSPD